MAGSTPRIHAYYFSFAKRGFDVALSAVLILLLLPLLVLIGLVILTASGWPILYTQQRLGKDKKKFTIYKFRVMYVGADKHQWRYRDLNEAPEPMYKNWHDPRYVGVGRWLSKTGLDELPQLVNILKGEMSFVGPRPLPLAEASQLDKTWGFRYQVKPGVFSEWSHASSRHTTLNSWKKLELETVKHGGLLYEVSTIGKTISQISIL